MNLRIRSKIWLEAGGEPLLGGGRVRLLRAIHRSGSINAAARQLGISYRKAWGHLQQMEHHLGASLCRRRKGGARGGETVLTEETVDLLERYEKLQQEVQQYVDRRFAEQFGTPPEDPID